MEEKKVGKFRSVLRILNLEIPCFVAEDGTRLISGRGITNAIGMKGRGQGMTRILTLKSISPFINEELSLAIQNPIRIVGRGLKTYGYEATILIHICETILKARDAGALKTEQEKRYGKFADTLVRAFAVVGIIAQIDEATGYQDVRMKDALEKILNQYLLNEAKKYAVTFPLELYKEWFKLNNWEWKVENAQKRPGVLGKWTNKYIYERMAPNLLEELQKRNPKTEKGYRKHKHFQFLTDEIGEPTLREFFGGHLALARATTTWRKYISLVEKAYPAIGDQYKLEFMDDEKDE